MLFSEPFSSCPVLLCIGDEDEDEDEDDDDDDDDDDDVVVAAVFCCSCCLQFDQFVLVLILAPLSVFLLLRPLLGFCPVLVLLLFF